MSLRSEAESVPLAPWTPKEMARCSTATTEPRVESAVCRSPVALLMLRRKESARLAWLWFEINCAGPGGSLDGLLIRVPVASSRVAVSACCRVLTGADRRSGGADRLLRGE